MNQCNNKDCQAAKLINPRYLLWMMYSGHTRVQDRHYEAMIWIQEKQKECKKMLDFYDDNGKAAEFADFDEWLIYVVRQHLIDNCSVSKVF